MTQLVFALILVAGSIYILRLTRESEYATISFALLLLSLGQVITGLGFHLEDAHIVGVGATLVRWVLLFCIIGIFFSYRRR
jgi:hypothetical protein